MLLFRAKRPLNQVYFDRLRVGMSRLLGTWARLAEPPEDFQKLNKSDVYYFYAWIVPPPPPLEVRRRSLTLVPPFKEADFGTD